MPASRSFNRRQALEKGIKDLYAEIQPAVVAVAATATLDLSTDIVLTSVAIGAARNTTTFQLIVNAAAANPGATILVTFAGTAAAITCTVTPNDGTNNGAVAVALNENELTALINTGVVGGKTITLTDASSRRILQTATGGQAANALVSGDNQTVSFTGGVTAVVASLVHGWGFSSVSRTDVGEYTLVLQDAYYSLRSADAIVKASSLQDLGFQLQSETVSTIATKDVVLQFLTGASPAEVSPTGTILVKLELKNSSAP